MLLLPPKTYLCCDRASLVVSLKLQQVELRVDPLPATVQLVHPVLNNHRDAWPSKEVGLPVLRIRTKPLLPHFPDGVQITPDTQ